MREGAEVARARSAGGGAVRAEAVLPHPLEPARGQALPRSLRVTRASPGLRLRRGPLVCASPPRLSLGPKLTTFVSRSSAGSQPRSRGPQQSRQTSARQR